MEYIVIAAVLALVVGIIIVAKNSGKSRPGVGTGNAGHGGAEHNNDNV